MISTEEYKWVMEKLARARERNKRTTIHMNRALQFCYSVKNSEGVYRCSAGDNLIVIADNGDILPCRRLPIKAGSIYTNTLLEVYENSDAMQQLRKQSIPEDCRTCIKASKCRGGAKCLTYAVTGRLDKKDINCTNRGSE